MNEHQHTTANIENSGDSGVSNFGSPHQAFVSEDRNVDRSPLLSISATRCVQPKKSDSA
jgi:hypothetical protein